MIAFDIDDEFETFMRKANPKVKETSYQYFESRRVFAAGVAAFYFYLTNELTEVSEDQGMRELEKVRQQLVEFFGKRVGFSD